MKNRSAFTIVELLVVISIIGLLIALLLPALARGRAASRSSVCASRMHQVGLGWLIYATDNYGVAVPGQAGRYADESRNVYWVGNGSQYRPRWFAQMGASAGFYAFTEPSPDPAHEHTMTVTNDVFLCPQVPTWTNTRNYPYGYNYQFLGNSRFKGDDESRGSINHPVQMSRIAFAQTVMAADCLGTAAGKPEALRTDNRPDGSRDPGGFARGGHGYALDPPRLTATSDFADTRLSSKEHRSGPDERHLGKANVSFCDGHVKTLTAAEMGYLKNADGSIAFTGEGATNKLFSGTARNDDPPDVN